MHNGVGIWHFDAGTTKMLSDLFCEKKRPGVVQRGIADVSMVMNMFWHGLSYAKLGRCDGFVFAHGQC